MKRILLHRGYLAIGTIITTVISLAPQLQLKAEVRLPAVIGDHMVLQRGMPVPIWGNADPDEDVTVSFREQRKTAKADRHGKWMVKLDPLECREPASMTVAGKNVITLTDVLVGEVWLGSGQSNMDTSVSTYTTDTLPASASERDKVLAQSAKGVFSIKDAVSRYHISDELLSKLAQGSYPRIRMISSRGGGGWQVAEPKFIAQFSALLFVFGEKLQEKLNVPIGLMFGAVGATSSEQWISRQDYESDEACKKALADFAAGYSFENEQRKYQAALEAPAGQAGKPKPPFHPGDVTRDLSRPNKNIGDLFELYVRPFIPYAIRGVLWDQGEGGSGIFGLEQNVLMGALIRGWRRDWGEGEFPFLYMLKPSGGGCAWDPEDPVTKTWADPFNATLPQHPPGTKAGLEREEYLKILAYPNTAMITASDLGGGTHPINKFGYGSRAALVALGAVYGAPMEYYGPLYDSFAIEKGKIRIKFTHTGKGLACRPGDELRGFQIAGEDRIFSWADAVIDGDTVVVSSNSVPKPVAVRYAWSKYNSWANLFNKDGLPAQAFRTDQWVEQQVK